MKLVEQVDYRGCTLLRFEQRVPHSGDPPRVHWMVVARDGINVLGSLIPTVAAARAVVDRIFGPDRDAHQSKP